MFWTSGSLLSIRKGCHSMAVYILYLLIVTFPGSWGFQWWCISGSNKLSEFKLALMMMSCCKKKVAEEPVLYLSPFDVVLKNVPLYWCTLICQTKTYATQYSDLCLCRACHGFVPAEQQQLFLILAWIGRIKSWPDWVTRVESLKLVLEAILPRFQTGRN